MLTSMVGLVDLLVIVALVAPAVSPAADPQALAGDLIEAQGSLVERAREYRASLERLLALEESDAERAAARARSRRDWLERGIVSPRELDESERLSQVARKKVDETRRRMAEADALMSETLAAIEVAKMPRAAEMELVATPAVIRYQGGVGLVAVEVSSLESFFLTRFGRPLPVSARGQTPVHDRLGLDHRHALDVAVHPDSEEGQSLIEYLRGRRIPFLAFRKPMPGASTGAHVHVGQVSAPLVPVRAIGR